MPVSRYDNSFTSTLVRSPFTSPLSVRYPSREGRIFLYKLISSSMAPSRISRVGLWGRKSLPTKKHMNTKSSTMRSRSYGKGSTSASPLYSISRYSRNAYLFHHQTPLFLYFVMFWSYFVLERRIQVQKLIGSERPRSIIPIHRLSPRLRTIRCEVSLTTTRATRAPVKCHHLTQHGEVRLVRCEAEHDEVCVEPADAMPRVRIVSWLRALLADELHDLVLALSWDGGV